MSYILKSSYDIIDARWHPLSLGYAESTLLGHFVHIELSESRKWQINHSSERGGKCFPNANIFWFDN